ncbi:helix-turn-helix domain-containing protein [Virgibacillus dakarensis]
MGIILRLQLYDERGNTYWGIDVDTHDRLRSKLMQGILAFKI